MMTYTAHSQFLPNWFVRRRGLADQHRLFRRRCRRHRAAAMAAVDHRAPTAGARRAGPWPARDLRRRSTQPSSCASGRRTSDCCPTVNQQALSRRPAARLERRRCRPGPPSNGRWRAPSAPAASGGSCSATSAPSSPGTPCRCTRRSTSSRSASRRCVAAWALGIVSVVGIPGQIALGGSVGPHRPRVGVDGGMRRVCNLLRGTDRARVLRHRPRCST